MLKCNARSVLKIEKIVRKYEMFQKVCKKLRKCAKS